MPVSPPIYYSSYGNGEPVVLLHAGSLTGDMWGPYLDVLAAEYRVIVPDLPGHGRSGGPERIQSYRQLANDVADFIRELNVPPPFVVGFSDGGQVALEIGMRHPSLARAIALGGVCFKFGEASRAFVRAAVGDEDNPDVDVARLKANHPDWMAWLDEIYGSGKWLPLLVALKRVWTTPLNYTTADFASVTAPTLVMVGDRDDLVPVEEAAELVRGLPGGELAVVPDADHSAFFAARASAFQEVIRDFLRRHDR